MFFFVGSRGVLKGLRSRGFYGLGVVLRWILEGDKEEFVGFLGER